MCGKTTLARAIGQVFYSLGLLAEPTVIERTASTLQTGYVGQAGLAAREAMDTALGATLLIDEAYQLAPSRAQLFNDEIVAQLVACLTQPKYKNKLVVILAGYAPEVRRSSKQLILAAAR